MKEIVKTEGTSVAENSRQEMVMGAIVKMAENPDLDPAKLEKFLEMQIMLEDRQAQRAFYSAFSAFQGECSAVIKNKYAESKGRKMYAYATFDEMVNTITPALTKHGLSYMFSTSEKDDVLEMTTTVAHTGGGSRDFKSYHERIAANAGTTSKAQHRRSAMTYAKKTALELALGIATRDPEEHEKSKAVEDITADQVGKIERLIQGTGTDFNKLLEFFKVANIMDMTQAQGEHAIKMLREKQKVGGKK